ncbi:MAG: 3'(2'),5'-bisphosphate nucleotidase CysQ [Robiginitomaculum sp.]|nr:3'(2'),5'-bisphosphate nucleotidase CysQ [Robiginitomaculum sp.]
MSVFAGAGTYRRWSMSQATPAQDLSLLETAARGAGALAMHWFANPGKVWDKGDQHPVTEADLAVDQQLKEVLRAARPDYGWLSEETVDDRSRLHAARVFIVDPIDGTRAFIQGKPHFSISIAIVEKGRPIAGAVFNPALDEMYLAAKDKGASLNGEPIRIRTCASLLDCRMIANEGLFRQKHWRESWPAMQYCTRNSMAYRIALVASGAHDVTLTLRPKSDWDLAAADLIANEAGATITDPDGVAFAYNLPSVTKSGVICAGRTLHDLIRQRM